MWVARRQGNHQGQLLGQVEQANYSLEHRPIQLDEML